MGSGIWSTGVYNKARAYRAAHGMSAFAYSDSGASRCHPGMDPKGVAFRESRDSDEHPESTAIVVLFDVTGSMGGVPRILQTKLPQLLGLLLRKDYVKHPQILFGAIGDATCDRAPLQVGQFESDNRMDDWLGKIYIEGGGGGQKTESYELAAYWALHHTAIDCHEKRGKRGYLFIVGDEMAYPSVNARLVERVIGDRLAESPSTRAVFDALRAKYDTYYVQPGEGSSYRDDPQVAGFWRGVLGQNYLTVDEPEAVAEMIALTIGLAEGATDLAGGLADLVDVGSGSGAVVGRALATLDASRALVAAGAAPSGLAEGADSVARI
jgi:hypothetical protein